MVRSDKFAFSSSIEGRALYSVIEDALEDHEDIRKWELSSSPRVRDKDVIYLVRVPDFTDSHRIGQELQEEIEETEDVTVNISI